MKSMVTYHEKKLNDPVEHLTIEDDLLVMSVSAKIFDIVGDVEGIDFPEEGSEVEAGAEILTINGSEEELVLRAPISGIVLEVNDLFSEDIAKAQDDPSHFEWLLKIEPQDPEDLLKFEE